MRQVLSEMEGIKEKIFIRLMVLRQSHLNSNIRSYNGLAPYDLPDKMHLALVLRFFRSTLLI